MAVEQSLGNLGPQLDDLFRATKPTSSDELVTVLLAVEPMEQLKRWAGLPEHPAATRMRLRLGRRWPEARTVWWTAKEDAEQKKSLKDADLYAWKALFKTYPPQRARAVAVPNLATIKEIASRVEAEKPKVDPAKLAKLKTLGALSNPLDDAVWVSEHFYDPDAIDHAPSRGAAMLWIDGQEHPERFWNTIWPRFAGEQIKRVGVSTGSQISPRERADIDKLYEMLRDAVKQSKKVV
jgi:hypothetical protein